MTQSETPQIPDPQDTPPMRKRKRRWAKRLGWAIAIVFAPILLAGAFLATPIGKRFVADQIAKVAPASGLRFTVGRIEGDLFNDATLHDVTLLDPEGAFLTVPEATLDWRPLTWLWSGLDIREISARRARLARLPQLLPGDPDAPLLPDFDIRVDRLAIENLTLAAGLAGEEAQRVDFTGTADIRSGRVFVDAQGALGSDDRVALLLDAEPDGDRFDLSLDYHAAADGPIAVLTGLNAAYDARIAGEGTWSNWLGHGTVWRQRGDAQASRARVAAFQLTNYSGEFGLLGQVTPTLSDGGLVDRAFGDALSLAIEGTLEDSEFDGRFAAVTSALDIRGRGALDLAGNTARDFAVSVATLDPDLLGRTARLQGALLTATLNGPFRDLSMPHRLKLGALEIGPARFEGLVQRGDARIADGVFTMLLETQAQRVLTGVPAIDPKLADGTMRGVLTYSDGKLAADNTRISFPGLDADLSFRGDLRSGAYAIAGPVDARGLDLPQVGTINATAKLLAKFGSGSPWSVRANLAGRLSDLANATVTDLAGDEVRFSGQFGAGADQPVILREVELESERLNARFDSRLNGDITTLAGAGRHTDYGPFSVEADIAEDGPRVQLVLADPYPAAGLADVRVGLAPMDGGFALDVAGGSLLGPFTGSLGVALPASGPARIAVDRLTVYQTRVAGQLTLGDAGLAGDLTLAGGGLDGTAAITPAAKGATSFALSLKADQARFGGDVAMALAKADIEAKGTFGGSAATRIYADVDGGGLEYGALRIERFAATADIADGKGDVTASIAGSRADRFALKLDGDIAPGRIALLARGEFAGNPITMPRRAVITALDGAGYRLAPTQIAYAGGYAILAGELGGADTQLSAQLARMPLRLADLTGSELGLSGRLSGTVTYQQSGGGAPTGSARLEVTNFARSGLVLSSRPIDALVGVDLTPDLVRTRARFNSDDGQLGQLNARVSGIAGAGRLADRIMTGALSARLDFDGPAQSLWRLAAIEAFDLTGPVTVSARAGGTLAAPDINGTLASDDLRVQSAVSGTDVTDVSARGRFAGSRLELTRFAGKTRGNGTVTGSGIVDLGAMSTKRGPRLDLRIATKDARLLNAAGLDATLTGPLRIVSSGIGGTIAGRVEIDRASWKLGYAAEDMALPQITTQEINLPNQNGERTTRTAAGSWRYMVDAKARSRVAVDGLGLDSEWGVDIALRGTVSDPRIGGQANLVRGDYTFAGTRFDLTRGRIRFDADVPIDPRLDIVAETDTGDYDVSIAITGNSQAPEIQFSAEPALPEEEILAQLLFGGSVTSLSATDAVQLGAALASLRGGGGGLDPIGKLRRSIGLDQLRIVSADPAIGRSTGVALGKNVGRKFYVEIVTDGRGYSATQLEYQITRWLALLGTVTTIGRDRVGVEISRDY